MRLRSCLLAALLSLAILAAPRAARATCDELGLGFLSAGLPGVDPDSQERVAARGVVEECGPQLTPALAHALDTFGATPLGERRALGLRTLQAEPALWKAACPAGDAVLAEAAARPAQSLAETRRALHRRCRLGWLGSEDELARGGPGVELALVLHRWLLQQPLTPARVRALTRSLAGLEGIEPPPQPGPPDGAPYKDKIRYTIRLHLNEVRFCYEKALLNRGDLAGRVLVQFTIEPDGRVDAVELKSSTLGAPDVEQCIVGAVRRWEFSRPDNGKKMVVSYPFVLKVAGTKTDPAEKAEDHTATVRPQ